MSVRHWTSYSPGEKNHPNCHAEVGGIEFFAFPYQGYESPRLNNKTASVSKGRVTFGPEDAEGHREFAGMAVYVSIRVPALPLGNSRVIAHESFTCVTTKDALDLAFAWAAEQLKTPLDPAA